MAPGRTATVAAMTVTMCTFTEPVVPVRVLDRNRGVCYGGGDMLTVEVVETTGLYPAGSRWLVASGQVEEGDD